MHEINPMLVRVPAFPFLARAHHPHQPPSPRLALAARAHFRHQIRGDSILRHPGAGLGAAESVPGVHRLCFEGVPWSRLLVWPMLCTKSVLHSCRTCSFTFRSKCVNCSRCSSSWSGLLPFHAKTYNEDHWNRSFLSLRVRGAGVL